MPALINKEKHNRESQQTFGCMVTTRGLEPTIICVKGICPYLLDDVAIFKAISNPLQLSEDSRSISFDSAIT